MSDLSPDRVGCITGSRMSDMLAGGKGITRAKYAAQLAAERMTGKPHRSQFTSAAMEHGNETESLARMQYEIRNGVMVEGTGSEFTKHPFIARSGASCDGLVCDNGLVEFKCPDSHTFIGYLLSGEIPSVYRSQMTWQLATTRRAWCDFVAFDPDLAQEDGYLQIRFMPTAKDITDLEREVRAFDAEVEQLIATIIRKRKP